MFFAKSLKKYNLRYHQSLGRDDNRVLIREILLTDIGLCYLHKYLFMSRLTMTCYKSVNEALEIGIRDVF